MSSIKTLKYGSTKSKLNTPTQGTFNSDHPLQRTRLGARGITAAKDKDARN